MRYLPILIRWYGVLFFAFGLGFAIFPDVLSSEGYQKNWDMRTSWIISPEEAYHLVHKKAIFLDARGTLLQLFPRVAEAKSISWETLSVKNLPSKGNLLNKKELIRELESFGIKPTIPVVVLGDSLSGWGEDGRIVWTLRTLGHEASFLVDGGAKAYKEYEEYLSEGKIKPGLIYYSELNLHPGWSEKNTWNISKLDLVESIFPQKQTVKKDILLIDSREKREFEGETPYGESRGGHIPGANWIHFQKLIDDKGFALSKEEIEKIIGKENSKKIIIPYCTGGVRSAWVTALLISHGYTAKNYAGSMWEWSAGDEKQFPLIKSK